MSKLKDVKIAERPANRPTKVLTIDAETVDVLRKVAKADGLGMSAFLDRALRAYIQLWHPDWELVEDDPRAAPPKPPTLLEKDLDEGTRGARSVFGSPVRPTGKSSKKRRR